MAGKYGVKETKELVTLGFVLAGVVAVQLKDGFQPGEDVVAVATKLTSSPEIQAAIASALDGLSQAPAEIQELDWLDMLELAKHSLGCLGNLKGALKAA